MSNWTTIKRIDGADGRHFVAIQVSDEGWFRFSEISLNTVDDETCWRPGWQSGLYGDAESAEREALATMPWLPAQALN